MRKEKPSSSIYTSLGIHLSIYTINNNLKTGSNMSFSLKTRLLICSLSAIAIMAISLVVISNYKVSHDALNNAKLEVQRLGTTYADSVSDWISDKKNVLSALKKPLQNTTADNITLAIQQAHESGSFSLTYYGTAEGQMYRQDPSLNRAGYAPRERPWFQLASQQGKLSMTAPYLSATQQVMVVTMAEPVYQNSQLIGVVGADLSLKQLVDEIINMDIPGNGYAVLINSDGFIVAHPDPSLWQKNINSISPTLSGEYITSLESSNSINEISIVGEERLIYAIKIKNTDWSLVYVMNPEIIFKHSTQLIFQQALIAVVLLFSFSAILILLFKHQFKDLERVSKALNEIAAGEADLTVNITTKNKHDEIGKLASGFNLFVARLHAMVNRLTVITHDLTEQSSSTLNSATNNSIAISTQQDEITMVATAVTEMASATQEIAAHAEQTANTAQSAVTLCAKGQHQVHQSQNSIRELAREVSSASDIISELNHNAHAISSILATITGIAEQTNLLALNAAIEAARAGEQGRGFAVVADEVRVLSQRTHSSTQEIQNMIETLQHTTSRAVSTMATSHSLATTSVTDADSASESLQQIGSAIAGISDMASHIATAAEEQTSVTAEINTNTESIREVSTVLSQESQYSSTQAKHLATLTQQLKSEIQQFKL
ncbi:MAG: methyl-accepting chemotaxis protein [Plesiomonas sp.]|uniref:methyl-accepting chemotaxis protein n=1 Tax=Plesiomonas sp. TaxID=2486279 RepID=UPI003F36FF29